MSKVYDFVTVPDRKDGTSMKWNQMYAIKPDVGEDVVPLSTADMEFPLAPEIVEGLKQYLDTHVLGYTNANDEYYQAVIDWMSRRHGYKIQKEWIVESAGVVPGFGMAISALSEPGDGVLVFTPIYFPMTMTIQMKGRRLVKSPLLVTDKGYEIDFEDFEDKASDPNVKLLLFCSPHNPIGRVWTRDELRRISDICLKYGVVIIDDEIHNDLIMPGYEHTVMATLSREASMNCIVCTAPSKTFSLAGMQTSNLIVEDPVKRAALMAEKMSGFGMNLNAMGYEACKLAYNKCEAWLDECIQVIDTNAKYVESFMAEHFPKCRVFPLEGTYLQWVDFRSLGLTHVELEKLMQQEAEIFMDEGYMFGENARGFERFNLACPTEVVKKMLERLYAAYLRCKDAWETEGLLEHKALALGDKIPDFDYTTPYEKDKHFAFETGGRKTLLIFSRYYTCGLCQSLLGELDSNKELLNDAGIEKVYVVMQSAPESLRENLGGSNPYDFEIICDKDERLYKRFEVFPANPISLMASPDLKKTLMAMAANPSDGKPEGNQNQRPAFFILDKDGIVIKAHYADGIVLPKLEEMVGA